MPDMQYNTGDLRTGAKHADAASESADQAASTLKGNQGASPFGNVTGGDALHGAVGTARQHHALNAQTTSENMGTAAVRAGGTANLGDDNTEETTQLAPRSEQASNVAKGM